MTSTSIWMDVHIMPNTESLVGETECDVAVIGSGIAGISTAYELCKRGKSVIVIDRGRIAGGMTSRTSAHLAPLCDDLVSEMVSIKGLEATTLFCDSHAAAVDRIEEIQKNENIDCDFRRLDGYLFQGRGMPADIIEKELGAVREVGAPVDRLMGVPFSGCESRQVLRYPRQAAFHPLKYLAGVTKACQKNGATFLANSPVEEVGEKDGTVTVKTARGVIRAKYAVVATNSSISDRFAIHTKTAPYRTYVMAFEIERGALPDALYWDTEDPYHYVRLQPGPGQTDFVLVGGEDHKSATADDADTRFGKLETWARDLIPALGKETHRWSGQVLETVDYAGFIGRDPGGSNIYVAMGDSGQGLTHGVMGAMLNTGLILGEDHPWKDLYAPGRIPLKAAKNFVAENTTAIKSFAEYVASGEIGSLGELKPGHGAIVRRGLEKIAAYRDSSGGLHLNSASCSHVGCHLHFNSFETCWDCPCHGSMFDVDGCPINAPAIGPLGEVKE
ncbi:FAD-dependent oxidoreductase [Nitrobacter winogradskyi]|uniref:Glycine/D-amino acid oxidase-like deaminating enzyme/nitrite reductase/ring-hydroxylating ferredoxin subunit n=2 Tax=Nitrobacter winogradskyi TaxID=913 RepID=A0ACC6AJ74_NITWI|nr:FAD-dependent oxidoreductase [Nitrobacter winogradskyi]MCP1999814.1 glycine/D-amino acid oxidase-like deaminating enzyme/nitrite reductase/ring-hydroxylating ferredoxin subunit [Nitrobacter winogradskyi]